MNNCTACPALRLPMRGACCALGIRTATTAKDGYRTRHPLETCARPKTDAEVAERITIINRERVDAVL